MQIICISKESEESEDLTTFEGKTTESSSEDQSRMQSNFYSWTVKNSKQELRDQLN